MYSISSLSKEFVRNTVGASLALLCIAVSVLFWENTSLQDDIRDCHGSQAETERRCAAEKDSLRREQLRFIQTSLERLQRLEERAKPRKRAAQR